MDLYGTTPGRQEGGTAKSLGGHGKVMCGTFVFALYVPEGTPKRLGILARGTPAPPPNVNAS